MIHIYEKQIKLLQILNAMSYVKPANVKRKNFAKNRRSFLFEYLSKALVVNCNSPGNFEILFYKSILNLF